MTTGTVSKAGATRSWNELPDVLAVIATKFILLNDTTCAAFLQHEVDNDPYRRNAPRKIVEWALG